MNIQEIIKSGANVQVVVNVLDLKELFLQWQAELTEQRNASAQTTEQLFSPKEFAQRHNVTTTTLWRWCKAGILTPTKTGGKTYYKESNLKVMEG